MQHLRNLAFLLGASLPFTLGGCTTDNTSSTAQLIECTDTGAGVTGCHAVETDSQAAATCVDRDSDDDGLPHDEDEAEDDSGHDSALGDTDDDDDGTSDADDGDDDNDGVDDDRDCDERHGGDDDDSGDA